MNNPYQVDYKKFAEEMDRKELEMKNSKRSLNKETYKELMDGKKKVYKLRVDRSRRGEKIIEGTIWELWKYFSYTIEIGYSHNKKIKQYPKTIVSLLSTLEKSFDVKEGCCYERTSISLVKE